MDKMQLRWLTDDPEIADRLRLADQWHDQQRREANRMMFNADRVKRAAAALARKAIADRQYDYAMILSKRED